MAHGTTVLQLQGDNQMPPRAGLLGVQTLMGHVPQCPPARPPHSLPTVKIVTQF